MTRTVLVPVDGSDRSLAALDYALDTFASAELTLFHAIDPFDEDAENAPEMPLSQEWLDERREAADRIFEGARERVASHEQVDGTERDDGDATTVETDVAVGSPAQTILGHADDTGVDQIVIGSHGRGGASALRLGSVSEVVVRRATVPVTVVR